jgi:hypothetical protein
MQKLFTIDDTWSGGFYELVFQLHESTTPQKALSVLWSHPDLEGWYSDRNREPGELEKAVPADFAYESHWYGIATLPSQKRCTAGSFWGKYTDIAGAWLTIYLPLGSLGRVYSIGAYPIKGPGAPDPGDWVLQVNDWLKTIAEDLFPRLRFSLALIGYEIEFYEVFERLRKGVPTERREGIILPEGNRLKWYPRTTYQTPMNFENRK